MLFGVEGGAVGRDGVVEVVVAEEDGEPADPARAAVGGGRVAVVGVGEGGGGGDGVVD
jgi:hypothetical protein